jgi:two-component system cell cycle sensor histidine kinase/response regulator CckA
MVPPEKSRRKAGSPGGGSSRSRSGASGSRKPDASPGEHSDPALLIDLFFSHVAIPFAVLTPELRFLKANQAMCHLLGYDENELLELDARTLSHPDDADLSREPIERALKSPDHTYVLEKRFLRKDGETVWVRLNGTIALDERGSPLYHLGVAEDIGGRKRSEQELAEAGERFREVFENAPSGIALMSLDGSVLDANPALCSMAKYSREELVGRSFADLSHPDDLEAGFERLQQLREGEIGSYRVERRFIGGDGEVVWTSSPISLVRDGKGKPLYFVAQLQDITEQKRAEQALGEATRRFVNAFDNSPIGMSIVDTDGRYLEVNPAICRMFGYSREQLLEIDFQTVTHPDDRAVGSEYVRAQLAGEAEPYWLEKRYIHSDGHEVWTRILSSLVRDESGQPRYFVTQVEDISERRRMEKQIQRAATLLDEAHRLAALGSWEFDVRRNELYWTPALYRLAGLDEAIDEPTLETVWEQMHPDDRVWLQPMVERAIASGEPFQAEYRNVLPDGRERTMNLRGVVETDTEGIPTRVIGVVQDVTERVEAEAARRQLEARMQEAQRLESLGVLAGGIAHDFNNLLVGILGNAGMASMELPPESPARLLIDQIEIAARRAAELTKQMLAYSGKGQFVVRLLDLREVVRETAALVESAISKNVSIRYEFAEDVPAVRADVAQMRQLVMNLITNASDAIGDNQGEIVVRIGAHEMRAAELASYSLSEELPETTYVSFEVSDTGAGMDAETLAKIFDPFFTTKFSGHGLGLAAALGIVRGHRGAIKVSSEPGKGSCFSLLLPAVDEVPATAETTAADLSWKGSGTILVVDDEEIVRRAVRRILGSGGLTVVEASSSREALELFQEKPDGYDAALVDLIMPGTSGIELVEELRSLRPDFPIVLSSGYDARALAEDAGGEAGTYFLQKPYYARELLDCVQTALGRS